jgi:aerobic C4-dicarboxylate transport protein
MFGAAIMGVVLALLFKVGQNIDEETLNILGVHISAFEVSNGIDPSSGFSSLLQTILPHGFIDAVVHGQSLPIVIFSTLFGIALGTAKSNAARITLQVFEGLFDACLKLIRGILYLLPLGLIAHFSQLVADAGFSLFIALAELLATLYIGLLILFITYLVILSVTIKKNIFRTLADLKEPLLIAFSTTSCFAAMPSTIISLVDKFKLKKEQVKLLVPLSICFNSQASAFIYSVAAVFSIVLFHVPISLSIALLVIIGSVIMSIAGSGAPTIVVYATIPIILHPLGIPHTSIVPLLVAISYFKSPFETAINLLGHCMLVVRSGWRTKSPSPLKNSTKRILNL